ncbi:hypothetical protein [Kitasatospora sp. NPDC059827]|uniref:hypothetical protein n=1 Tax=Kitasatospora sp. NPDC059827 TaxID=3346964 RepID=UPI00365C73FB
MSRSTTRRARTLAGAVLTVALLVPAATACSSSADSATAAAPTGAPAVTGPATTPTAPAGSPADSATPSASGAPASPAPASPGAHGSGAPATPTGAHRSTPPAGAGKGAPPVAGQSLPDGSKLEVQKLGDLHYVGKIVNAGQVLGTIEADGRDTGLDANGMFVVLAMDGTVHAWTGGAHQGPGTFKLAGGWTAKVTKVGELHYRADIIGNENAVMGTVESDQHDAGLDANGVYIVLSTGGVISSHE